MERYEPVTVRCHAGYRADEEPRAFTRPRKPETAIVEVTERWAEPRFRFFRVRSADGATTVLRHDEAEDRWEART